MGFIQNIINRFLAAPENRYEGANNSIRRSYLDTSYTSARFDVTASTRQQIVRKSRFFEQNNAVMNRLGDLFESYTVGSNFSVQPASSDPEWNLRAKKWWDIWSRYPDIGSRQSFGTLMSLAARGWFFDGESFILLTKGETGRPRLQLIEPQQIATPNGQESKTDIFDGVRFDTRTGRAVAYFVGQEQKQGELSDVRSLPSDSIVHIFEPQRAGQLRGLPFVACVINDLHDLDDLQRLEMDSCKLASSVAQVVKTSTGEVQATSLRSGGTGPQGSAQSYYENIFGSAVKVMKHGDEFEQFMSDRPSVNMREYWRQLTEKVCAGIGIPYVLVFPESMQGTVYRGALDMSSVWFRSRHQVMASAARRIWEYVMEYAIRVDPTLQNAPEDWYEVAIQAPRAPNVDVGRNSAAQLAELGSGVTTFDEIYGARGIDWRSALESKAQQAKHIRDLAVKYGIDVSEISTTQKVQIAPEPFDDVAEDSEEDRSENDNGEDNGNGSQRTNGNVLAVAPAKNRGKRRKKK
jgi:lambda family phage portal protein